VPKEIVAIETIDDVLIIVRDHDLHGVLRAVLRSMTGILADECVET